MPSPREDSKQWAAYTDGILLAGDAAGFSMNIGVTVRGMEYALLPVIMLPSSNQGQSSRGFHRSRTGRYENLLNESFCNARLQELPGCSRSPGKPKIF
jgi:electron transfer flavoprotein-quinone oxidoreductase